jgi:hypothetical protein
MEKVIKKYSAMLNKKTKLIGSFHHTTGEITNNFEIKLLKELLKDLNKVG